MLLTGFSLDTFEILCLASVSDNFSSHTKKSHEIFKTKNSLKSEKTWCGVGGVWCGVVWCSVVCCGIDYLFNCRDGILFALSYIFTHRNFLSFISPLCLIKSAFYRVCLLLYFFLIIPAVFLILMPSG